MSNTYDPTSGTWVNKDGHTDLDDPRNKMVPIPQEDTEAKPAKATYTAVKEDTKKSK